VAGRPVSDNADMGGGRDEVRPKEHQALAEEASILTPAPTG